MSPIFMMCSHTPFTLVNFNDENFIIRVLANTLSEVMNSSSIAFSKALMLVCCSVTSDTNKNFGLYEHDAEAIRSLLVFMKSQLDWSVGFSKDEFVFSNHIIYVHAP